MPKPLKTVSLDQARATLASVTQDDVGAAFALAELLAAAAASAENFSADVARVAPLFAGKKIGHDYAMLFDRWRENPPSMSALLAVALDELRISPDEPAARAAALVAQAADVPLGHAYHDNNHFREVTAMMAIYLRVNRQMVQAGDPSATPLSENNMAKCLLAAIGHDLLHNGRGNTVDGVHQQYRLENQAIDAMMPLMKLAGMSDADCAEVAAIIRVTDVSAPKGGISPHKVLRKLVKGEPVVVPPELADIASGARLRAMAALMSDADLAPSGATNYITSHRQIKRVAAENPALAPTDENLLGFLAGVIEKEFISPAARQHSQNSLSEIFAKTAARIANKQGNTPPPPKP